MSRPRRIVLSNGRVLTNAHNVRSDQVTVTFADGRAAEGRLAGRDIDADLAVIEVDTGGAAALPWASEPPPRSARPSSPWPIPAGAACG